MPAVKANSFGILYFELSHFIKQDNGVTLWNTRKKFPCPSNQQQGLITHVYYTEVVELLTRIRKVFGKLSLGQ